MQKEKAIKMSEMTSKDVIIKTTKSLVDPVLNGEVSALDQYVKIKGFEKVLGDAKKQIETLAVDESDAYGKRFQYKGVDIEQRETGVKYDFTHVSSWVELQNKIDDLREQQKVIETMVKAATIQHPYVDPTTGETITGCPKTSTSSIVLKFK